MSKTFPCPMVKNIDSDYHGFVDDINNIILETGKEEFFNRSASGIPWLMMKNRLQKLKYVCLINTLTYRDIRLITDCVSEEDSLINELEDMFDSMEIEVEKSVFLEEGIEGIPCYNYLEEIVIDSYGIYTSSIYGVLKKLVSEPSATKEVRSFEKKLAEGLIPDGPAILLCPESIVSIYSKVNRALDKEYPLGTNPHYSFLKMTYLHELGHHVYPPIRTNKYVWEALANFFAFGFLNPAERTLLYSKTLTQPYPYQSYCGLLFLLYPQLIPELNIDSRNRFQLAASAQCFIEKIELSIFERGLPIYDDSLYQLLSLIHSMFYHKNEIIFPAKGCILFLSDLFRQNTIFNFKDIVSIQKSKHVCFSDPKISWSWSEKVNQCNRIIIR